MSVTEAVVADHGLVSNIDNKVVPMEELALVLLVRPVEVAHVVSTTACDALKGMQLQFL